MEYKMEELLPVVAKLSKRYTSNESTSVSYNTARQLMEAALYCIQECEGGAGDTLLEGKKVDSVTAYEEGYRIVLDKVEKARKTYHRIIPQFDDYGCKNYRETIIKGIPAFFLKYDPRFEPQNHILTLDYPALIPEDDKTGIDKILEYLTEIEYEQIFLQNFNRAGVMSLLEMVRPNYEELYFENICRPVLIRAAACMIAGEELYNLKLSEAGAKEMSEYFSEISIEIAGNRFGGLLDMLEKQAMGELYKSGFKKFAGDFSVMIQNEMLF
ncbi:MAG: DUF6179 domain-containing protein [Muricomes sp.]